MIGSIDTERFVGLPYAPQGRGPDAWDCWGLVIRVYRESFGVDLPSYAGAYSDPPETRERSSLIDGEAASSWVQVQAHEIEPGDVMRAWLTDPTSPVHVGVMVDRFRVLHLGCLRRMDGGIETSRIERIDSAFLRPRVVGIYRYLRA